MPPSPSLSPSWSTRRLRHSRRKRGIVAARDQARVLHRDHRLIIVAVERPGLHLAFGALAAVQERVERMQTMIAPRADIAQSRLEFLAASSASQHDLHAVLGDLPAVALDMETFGRAVDQDRIGVVDVHVDAPRGDARRVPQASRRRRRSACGPCGGRSWFRFRSRSSRRRERACRRRKRRRRGRSAPPRPGSPPRRRE